MFQPEPGWSAPWSDRDPKPTVGRPRSLLSLSHRIREALSGGKMLPARVIASRLGVTNRDVQQIVCKWKSLTWLDRMEPERPRAGEILYFLKVGE